MPTYVEVQNRVADILNRSIFSTQIKVGIQAAIAQYEKERFWFNETSTALTAVLHTQELPVPSDFLWEHRMEIQIAGQWDLLYEKDFDFIRKVNIDPTVYNIPSYYTRYGDNFLLANIPDSAYAVQCFYVQKLPALSADSDTNDWLSAADNVIVFAAAKHVNALFIKDMSAANACAQMEQLFATQQLYGLREQKATGKIKATRF